MAERQLIERWESRGGAHYVELYRDQFGYSYVATHGGGYLGQNGPRALERFATMLKQGYFQPDANVTPMHRVV